MKKTIKKYQNSGPAIKASKPARYTSEQNNADWAKREREVTGPKGPKTTSEQNSKAWAKREKEITSKKNVSAKDAITPLKKGAKVAKAKDGKWIQKAINPKHKGYCTPMTKKTCTPKRKALAMTLKKMAKSKKGK